MRPKTMRALRMNGPGELELCRVALPELDPGEVLVQVAGAGLCASDLHVLQRSLAHERGLTLGHETAGHVVEVGAGVTGVDEGDPVLVYVAWACGNCRACVEGRENACVTTAGRLRRPPCPGLGPDGGMAEYIKAPARHLMALGNLDPVAAAPLADAGLTPMHAINGARDRLLPGGTAVVIGVGGLGHMAVQILQQTTAVQIIAVDVDKKKLDFASSLGADESVLADSDAPDRILAMTGGYGADVVFDFVSVAASISLATNTIAADGHLRLVGVGGGTLTYPAVNGVDLPWGVAVVRSYGGSRRDQQQVIDLAAAGRIGVRIELYSLDEGVRAFEDLAAGRIEGRAVLVP